MQWIKARNSGKPCKPAKTLSLSLTAKQRAAASGHPGANNSQCLLGPLGGSVGSFDPEEMFRINEERFGCKSDYSIDQYTTPLKHSPTATSTLKLPSPKESNVLKVKATNVVPPKEVVPGGSYRECTVPDLSRGVAGSGPVPLPVGGLAASAFDALRRPSSGSMHVTPPAHAAARPGVLSPTTNPKTQKPRLATAGAAKAVGRKKGEEDAARPMDGVRLLQRGGAVVEGMVGPVAPSLCSEFGMGFRFNHFEVMEPILAMS